MLRRLALCVTLSVCFASPAMASGPFAYLTNYWNHTVTVVDTALDQPVATISVADYPFSAAVYPGHSRVYVTHRHGPGVTVIDTTSNTVIAVIDLRDQVRNDVGGAIGVAVHPDGSRAYVTETPSNPYHGNSVAVIDTASNTLVKRIDVGIFPHGVAFSPSGSRAFEANWANSSGTLSVVDTTTDEVVATIAGMGSVSGVAVSPSGEWVYATDWNSRVLVIATATNSIVGQIDVDPGPTGVAVSPDGTRIYVADSAGVKVVDAASNARVASIPDMNPVVRGFTGIAVDPTGAKVYATRYYYQYVAVIDARLNQIADEFPWGAGHNAYGAFVWHGGHASDTTPPIITPSIHGTVGQAGWYVSDVLVTWDVRDPESELGSVTGCESVTVTSDTVGTTYTCEATSAGGPSSSTVTIKRDTVKPTVACSVTPTILWPANHKMWEVTATATASDANAWALNGIETHSSDADSGLGAGDVPNDIQGFPPGMSSSGQLRAERYSQAGRTYTVNFAVADEAGNTGTCAALVTVPHDQGKGGKKK